MKAALFEELNKMVVTEIPTPQPGPGEALVRVRVCAVCGSDVRIFRYGNPRVHPPQVIGHEVAGEVVEVGDGVTRVKVGDRIALGADVPCGLCHWCQNGMGTNCDINYAIGYQFPGGFAEYILLNKTTLDFGPVTIIPDDMPFDKAALAEPLACAINGLQLSMLSVGQTICLIGAGPIGCMMIPLSRHIGASRVIVIQRSATRLELAKKFGADLYINSSETDPVEVVKEFTQGEGPDVVLTTCGSVEAHEQAIEMVRHRGYVNLFGGLRKGARNLNIPSNLIHYKECYVHGSHGSLPRHHRWAVDMIENGVVPVKDIITHRFPLDRINDALAANEDRLGLKAVVLP